MFLLHPDITLSLSCWLSQFSFSKLRQSNVRMEQFFFNWANLIPIISGKSGIVKFEFTPT